MRKFFISAVTAVTMSAVLLSGCAGSGNIVDAAKKYGMKEAQGDMTELAKAAVYPAEDVSIYYVSKDSKELDYMRFAILGIGSDMEDPDSGAEQVVMCVKNTGESYEQYGSTEQIYQITAKDEESAKAIYEQKLHSMWETPVPREKNGYTYAIDYKGDELVTTVHGAYLKGNQVIWIYGFFHPDNGNCIKHFCKQLGLESPTVLKN
ncbi:MAG: hypothetical protein J5715_07115 [Clostridiales bacterium]|nr:hypothetical protein [Clostridiales bacterium]